MKKINIVMADDHVAVRSGLKALLESERDMIISGEAGDGLELVGLAESLSPDVLLVDVKMPNLNGIDAAGQVIRRFPHIHAVVYSMYDDPSYIERAQKAGVCGYVLKQEKIRELFKAIRYAAKGKRYLSKGILEQFPNAENLGKEISNPLELLSARERQVFQMIAEGKTNKGIALQLKIGIRTVESHREKMMSKLNLKNPADVVRFAVKYGFIRE